MHGNDQLTGSRQLPNAELVVRKSGLQLILHTIRTFGFTHHTDGLWLMLPKEFDAILALETKAVAQVILELMRETIGWVGNGAGGRREWVSLGYMHFVRRGLMSHSAARRGLDRAVKQGYVIRRRRGKGFEYSLKWKGVHN